MNHRHNRILVLHTNEQMIAAIGEVLQEQGLRVSSTWDPVEAISLAESRQFELLLVADDPPHLNASEILRDIQSGRIRVPCVVLQQSGGKASFGPEYFYSLGASGVISNYTPYQVGRWIQDHFSAGRASVSA